jgi:cytochrome c oxidase subunit 2
MNLIRRVKLPQRSQIRDARQRDRSLLCMVALIGVLTGCNTPMSIFETGGPAAESIARITWFLIIAATLVFIAVMITLFISIWQGRRKETTAVDLSKHSSTPVVVAGAIIPAIILVVIFIVGLGAMSSFPSGNEQDLPHFQVIGHQWWWEVIYQSPSLSGTFKTANELHVPVGQPVIVSVLSADVIHSFWVPELQGKMDLIPGDTNVIRILATHAGVYHGQCSEYCGLQHAHMGFVVVAEPPSQFRAWLAKQQAPARAPIDSLTLLGRQLVTTGPCALCHTIRGTDAQGRVAPDLTHVGSRRTLAAGAYSNTLGTMEAWITNAQSLKPGALMPRITQFDGRELRAMATYLETLQ